MTPIMNIFEYNNQKMAYLRHGHGKTAFIWVHGWGSNHQFFTNLSKSLSQMGTHYVVDIPGFGESPQPDQDWDLTQYAEFFNHFLDDVKQDNIIWVGHSYGCRVGVKLAASYKDSIDKMVLIAAAGLPQKRSPFEKLKVFFKVKFFKLMKLFIRSEEKLNQLRSKHGSTDYKNAGTMRPIFIKTVSENLSEDAKNINCPVALYYGENDLETKPDMGSRYSKLIKDSKFETFKHLDHFSIVTKGQSQIAQRIKKFIET